MNDPGSDADHEPGALPRGSVVPGADIWDDVEELTEDPLDADDATDVFDLDAVRAEGLDDVPAADLAEGRDEGGESVDDGVHDDDRESLDDDDDSWMIDAQQVIARADDDGPHDGSRGVEADDETSEAFGSKLQRWGATSMMGASLSGIGLGIEKALFGKESTQIEIEADDDDDGRRDPIRVKLDPDDPDKSVAVLRPWLSDRGPSGTRDDPPG